MSDRILVILCSCIYPTNIEYSNNLDLRIQQYKDGLKKFFDYNTILKDNNVNICLIDNSVNTFKGMPDEILNCIPDNVKIIWHSNNDYGSKNKECGLIENWLYIKDIINDYKWIIHFEPKNILKDFNFIQNFLNNKRNLFTMSNSNDNCKEKNHFNRKLFCIDSETLINYINNTNLNSIVKNKISIKDDLYNFILENNIEYNLLE